MADRTVYMRSSGVIHVLAAGMAQPRQPLPPGYVAVALVIEADDGPDTVAAVMDAHTAAVVMSALVESARRRGCAGIVSDALDAARDVMRAVPRRGHDG